MAAAAAAAAGGNSRCGCCYALAWGLPPHLSSAASAVLTCGTILSFIRASGSLPPAHTLLVASPHLAPCCHLASPPAVAGMEILRLAACAAAPVAARIRDRAQIALLGPVVRLLRSAGSTWSASHGLMVCKPWPQPYASGPPTPLTPLTHPPCFPPPIPQNQHGNRNLGAPFCLLLAGELTMPCGSPWVCRPLSSLGSSTTL